MKQISILLSHFIHRILIYIPLPKLVVEILRTRPLIQILVVILEEIVMILQPSHLFLLLLEVFVGIKICHLVLLEFIQIVFVVEILGCSALRVV